MCRTLEPIPRTPLSPPSSEQGPSTDIMTPMPSTTNQYPASTHVQNQLYAIKFTDCQICGKTTEQIKKEAVDDYISRTVWVGETEKETEAKKEANAQTGLKQTPTQRRQAVQNFQKTINQIFFIRLIQSNMKIISNGKPKEPQKVLQK